MRHVRPSTIAGSETSISVPPPGVAVQPFSRTNVSQSSVVPVNYETPVADMPGQSTTFPQNKRHGKSRFRRLCETESHLNLLPASKTPLTRETARVSRDGNSGLGDSAGALQLPIAGLQSGRNVQTHSGSAQRIGATYYLLEAWGDHKDAFRFYCRMPIGGNPQVWRPFQHVDADPLKAMATYYSRSRTGKNAGKLIGCDDQRLTSHFF